MARATASDKKIEGKGKGTQPEDDLTAQQARFRRHNGRAREKKGREGKRKGETGLNFLAFDEAHGITGQAINVDGGQVMS